MVKFIEEADWKRFLLDYSARHRGKPVRLGVLETIDGVTNDHWIDDDLMLISLDLCSTCENPRVDLLFENYAHTVNGASNLFLFLNEDGSDLGLDILDANGKTTLIRFEDGLNRESEG